MNPNLNFHHHPCFDSEARSAYARIHLPVAPHCNVQCKFCNRKYDCANEHRPGVTTAVLNPGQALMYLTEACQRKPNISVVGIAGPGDPFADAAETMETLRLVRMHFPKILLCVASNGLGLAPHVDELDRLRVSHVTLTINAVDPEIGAHIYAWVRPDKKPWRGREGAEILLNCQREAMRELRKTSILVKINTIVIPGVNEDHVLEVANTAASWGATIMNCVPLIPAPGSDFEHLSPPDSQKIYALRKAAGDILPQMSHCAQCRADACGIVGEENTEEDIVQLRRFSTAPPAASADRPYVAVATREGLLVNEHLGEASTLTIFEKCDIGWRVVAIRPTPEAGLGVKRWLDMAELLKDCRAILVSGVGTSPRVVLSKKGLLIVEMEGLIEEGLAAVFDSREIPAHLKRRFTGCGAACSGGGQGCA
jgi:nitrogen fixation protein NifB